MLHLQNALSVALPFRKLEPANAGGAVHSGRLGAPCAHHARAISTPPGEAQAKSPGVNLWRVRLLAFAGAVMSVGVAGFIGLVAPHLVPWRLVRPGRRRPSRLLRLCKSL